MGRAGEGVAEPAVERPHVLFLQTPAEVPQHLHLADRQTVDLIIAPAPGSQQVVAGDGIQVAEKGEVGGGRDADRGAVRGHVGLAHPAVHGHEGQPVGGAEPEVPVAEAAHPHVRVVEPADLEGGAGEERGVVGDAVLEGEGEQVDGGAGELPLLLPGAHQQRGAADQGGLGRLPGRGHQRLQAPLQPLVVVELEGDEVSARQLDPLVDPQGGETAIELVADVDQPRIGCLDLRQEVGGAVSRAVVHHDQLEVAEPLREDAPGGALEEPPGTTPPGRQDHRDRRPLRSSGSTEDPLVGQEVAGEEH